MALVPTMRTGGAERVISLLLQQLDRESFELELTTVYDADFAYSIPDDVPVHVLAHRPEQPSNWRIGLPRELEAKFGDSNEWMSGVAAKLVDLISESQPDIVISSPMWASLLASVAHEAMPAKTRLVNRVDAPPSVSLAQSELEGLFGYYMRSRFNSAARIIAVSNAVGRDLVENFGIDPSLVQVVPNPVDNARIHSLAAEEVEAGIFSDSEPSVVFVGRLERVKGLEYLVRGIALVRKSTPVRLVLVGDGSQRSYLEALTRHLGIEEHVVLAGRQPNPFKFMRRGDVFVLPSLSEGMPNVILEAMASGCAVIASDIAGGISREILEDGRCGIVVPREDAVALGEAIRTLLADENLRRLFVERGLKRASDFDLPDVIRRNQDLLLAVSGEPHGGSDTPAGTASPKLGAHASRPVIALGRGRALSANVMGGLAGRLPLANRVASASSVLMNDGWRTLGIRGFQEIQYGLATTIRLPRSLVDLSGEPKSPSEPCNILVVVADEHDLAPGLAADVVLRRIDRSAFRPTVVRIYAGQRVSTLPRDIPQLWLQPRGWSQSAQAACSLPSANSRDGARLNAAASGLAAMAAAADARVILAVGAYAGIVASASKQHATTEIPVVQLLPGGAWQLGLHASGDTAYSLLLRRFMPDADHLVVGDRVAKTIAEDSFAVEPGRVTVIADPIDVAHADPVDATDGGAVAATPMKPYIVCATGGTADASRVLIRALAYLRDREDVHCYLVHTAGDGLDDLVDEFAMGDSVALVGETADLSALLDDAEVLVQLAPKDAGRVPRSVLAAVARECPVVTTSGATAVCNLLAGDSLVVTPEHDAESLAEGILRVLWDDTLRDTLVRRSAERVAGRTSSGAVLLLENVLRMVLGGPR